LVKNFCSFFVLINPNLGSNLYDNFKLFFFFVSIFSIILQLENYPKTSLQKMIHKTDSRCVNRKKSFTNLF
jgi:hypothetical protein